ncbi:MAG: hypothetical protein RL095_569 [Verrucomicrobiota bacterium]|jgi:hypothetical protein
MSWTRAAKILGALALFVAFMDAVLFMGMLTTWLIGVPGRLIFGFIPFLNDRLSRLDWQPDALLSGLLWFGFATLMLHLVQHALLRRFRPEIQAKKRRSLAALLALTAILLATGAGTFCLATAPKTEWGVKESRFPAARLKNALKQAGLYYHSSMADGSASELHLGDPRQTQMLAVFEESCSLPCEVRWIADDQGRILFMAARLHEISKYRPYQVLFPDAHVESMDRWPVPGDLK